MAGGTTTHADIKSARWTHGDIKALGLTHGGLKEYFARFRDAFKAPARSFRFLAPGR